MNPKKNSDILSCCGLTALWLIMVPLVNPVGDFPLNDDWAYGKPILTFLETGRIGFTSWPSMTLIGHLLLGMGAVKLFGFSFTVLRGVAVLGGLISVNFFYLLFRRISGSVATALAFTLGIAFNPLFFSLSYTFMTDVPFICFSVMLVYGNIRFNESGRRRFFLVATVSAVCGVLIRQPGVVIPFSFFIAAVLAGRENGKLRTAYLIQFIITLAVLLLYEYRIKFVLGYSHDFTNADMNFIRMIIRDPGRHFARFAYTFFKVPIYLGLFSLPVLPFVIPNMIRLAGSRNVVVRFAAAGMFPGMVFLCLFELQGRRLPFGDGNVLCNFGLGPAHLYSTVGRATLPPVIWQGLSVAGVTVFTLVITAIIMAFRNSGFRAVLSDPANSFPALFAIIYLPIVSVISFSDRYVLPALLMLYLLVLSVFGGKRRFGTFSTREYGWSIAILLPLLLFSLLGTRDYLSWNRARWEGLCYLTDEMGVTPRRIDGGFEFNGWYNYESDPGPGNNWWWVTDDEYVVTFEPVPGYAVLRSFPYRNCLPWQRKGIVVSKRKP